MLIDVTKISKDFGFGEIFGSLSFSVNPGDRIALVGRNGCGKSTILKIIMGRETPTSGSVNISKDLKLSMLDQACADISDDRVVEEILHEPFGKFASRQKSLDQMQERMSRLTGVELEKLVEKYSNALEQFVADGGYDIEQDINYIVNGLKISQKIRNQKYSDLSGGEKTLVQFAKILLTEPDVLLLDEPTNHLDIERIEWLEGYLQRFKGALIVVSHDRYFLDKVARVVIDVEDNGYKYAGNYSYFVKEKENKELKEFEQYKNEQKKLSELKKAVERLYAWGEKADNPSMFRRAKAIQKRIDTMEANATKKPTERKDLPINLTRVSRGSEIVFDVKDLSLILGDKIIFDDASFQMRVGSKIAIVGLNGMGKTSLIKCLLNQIEYMGTIKVGNSIKIGYLPQILTFDDDKQTILEYVENETGYKEEASRRLLAKFDFYKNDIDKKIFSLSGGEKVRIKIACMLTKDINTFIFDEPTNHIDIFTRETLEKAMSEYKGNILFVSHDRYFISSIANGILELKDYKLNLYEGTYEDYKNKDVVKVEEKPVVVKVKPPKISKGGKWWWNANLQNIVADARMLTTIITLHSKPNKST